MKLHTFIEEHYKILLFFILLLASLIRFYSISNLPVSLYWDEVAVGYSAYNLLETGKDEYGHTLPLLFESYNDFKMPVYVYLSTIPIALFGLNEFSVRFISATAGVVTVLFAFLVTRELLRFNSPKKYSILPLLVALMVTLTPWHIQFSRVGFEANLALLFITAGVYFMLKATSRSLLIIPSTVLFALSCYTYRSEIVFSPLFFIFLLILLRRYFSKRQLLTTIIGFLLLLSPLVVAFSGGDERASQVTIFSLTNPHVIEAINRREQLGDTLLSKIVYNRRVIYAEVAVLQYLSHFVPNFLFINGDTNMRHTVSGNGLMYLWQLPFLIIGIIYGWARYRKIILILFAWIAFAPLAASVSIPSPHALRSLPMLIPVIILIAFGIEKSYQFMRTQFARQVFLVTMLTLVLLSGILFGKAYIYHNGVLASNEWGDGYKQLLNYIKLHEDEYDKIIISGHYWQPYMYTLFYTKYNPVTYQKNGSSIAFDKYYFGGTDWDKDRGREELHNANLYKLAQTKKTLVALSPGEFYSQKKNLYRLTDIYDHNQELIFIVSRLR